MLQFTLTSLVHFYIPLCILVGEGDHAAVGAAGDEHEPEPVPKVTAEMVELIDLIILERFRAEGTSDNCCTGSWGWILKTSKPGVWGGAANISAILAYCLMYIVEKQAALVLIACIQN